MKGIEIIVSIITQRTKSEKLFIIQQSLRGRANDFIIGFNILYLKYTKELRRYEVWYRDGKIWRDKEKGVFDPMKRIENFGPT